MQEMKEEVYSNSMVVIKPGRRVGNTTRICDNAIQQLFSGKKVIVSDHHFSQGADTYLKNMILKNLNVMHGIGGSEHLEIVSMGRTVCIDLKLVDEEGNYIRK